MLIAGHGTQRVPRQTLAVLPVPEKTETHQPVSHDSLVAAIERSLAFRHIQVVAEEYVVSEDGMRMFGLMEVNAEFEGVRFAIGLRNANDKSMRVGIVAGYRVTVCSNMAFAGDFRPMLAKHSKHFDLEESVGIAIDRIQRNWEPLREAIYSKQHLAIGEDVARSFIYKAFLEEGMPISLIKYVHSDYFGKQGFTAWDLENSFTQALKCLNPISQYQQTARLGKLIAAEFPPSKPIDLNNARFC